MAYIKWAKGIDFVSGLLSKRPKKGTMHSDHQSTLLATHRVAETTNPDCTRIYMVGEYNRSTPVLPDEVARRERFAAVSAMVAALADLKASLEAEAKPAEKPAKKAAAKKATKKDAE